MDQLIDFDCPICLQVIMEPVKLPQCGHTFCYDCLITLSDQVIEEFKCPYCRTSNNKAHLEISANLEQQIQARYPIETAMRLKGINESFSDLAQFKLKIIYGNKHQKVTKINGVDNNFTLFLRVEAQRREQNELIVNPNLLIQSVTFHLKPTYKEHIKQINQPPYKVSRIGYRTFKVPISVSFHPMLQMNNLEVSHWLSFINSGAQNIYPIQLNLIQWNALQSEQIIQS